MRWLDGITDSMDQEAERERQAVGQGAYGGRRGRVRGLGLAATAWAQGGPLSPVGPRCSGRHSAGALSSLALTRCTDFFALGRRVQREGYWALLAARRRELAGPRFPRLLPGTLGNFPGCL